MKIINRYICAMVLLFTFTGYAQWFEGVGGNAPYYGSNTIPPGYTSPFTFTGTNQLSGVTITTAPSGPNWAEINAKADAEAAARAAAIAINIPKQPVIPPPTGGIIASAPPKPTAPPPTPKPDPCAEIKKALADAQFKAMMTELESPAALNKHNETGYWQDNKGVYHPMEINGNRAVKMPADMSTMENFTHVHMNDWKDPVTGVLEDSYPMPSPADIAKVYALGYNSNSNGLNLANTYVGNISYLGSFQMRYVGNSGDLTAVNFNKIYDAIKTQENEEAYKLAMEQNGDDVAALLAFLRDTLKITDIAIYKIEATGASKVELGANNQITKTPCN